MSARILVVAGSLRSGSHNRRLAGEAARLLAVTSADVTMIDLADYPLPIFDGDLESASGVPENAVLLAQRIAEQDGMLVVSPEYNASIPPLLKNALDWVSRVRKIKGRPVEPFSRLVVTLASASPGRLGGLRGLAALRLVFQALGAEILTRQLALPDAAHAFDAEGRIADEAMRTALDRLVDALVTQAEATGRRPA